MADAAAARNIAGNLSAIDSMRSRLRKSRLCAVKVRFQQQMTGTGDQMQLCFRQVIRLGVDRLCGHVIVFRSQTISVVG